MKFNTSIVGTKINTWWEVVEYKYSKEHRHYILKLVNSANGVVLDNVSEGTMEKILKGEIQLSKVLSQKLKKQQKVSSQQGWW